ncbi:MULTISPECIES: hypothetical protein [Brevibacillus]|jgi:hypothetical protein|uniref:Uncharacterized protein n=1 Tax=Brevibacillus thermoruber TaxID=33942 RepID=A0A9X3Z283_9BACL|nr:MULTISPECIES: hypothetical protein [Brevibacillus]MDA5107492.1 hypothetical protein [Brevibacillus thermoruber]TRY26031.1 hypothetical protein FOI68_09870 [Brevibacillus sp. LEMMJ03]UYZ14222.1 hypothetical protein A6764_04435 [Brevibacillus sp. WF146]
MFGFGKKAKKMDGIDVLLIKTEESQLRDIYMVAFRSMYADDIVSMLQKLEKSPLNKREYLGELGGFRIMIHLEAMTGFSVLDDADMEAHPLQISDFANILLRRLETLEANGELPDSEDVAFFMGELTMLRDGSFIPQN